MKWQQNTYKDGWIKIIGSLFTSHFIEAMGREENGDAVLIADGPPIGFPKANLLTGYFGINAGMAYRFKKNK